MQNFNFALRQSAAESVDDNRSRYVPSSIYSGPGPAEEYPIPPHPTYVQHRNNVSNGMNGTSDRRDTNGIRNTYQRVLSNAYAQPVRSTRPKRSSLLDSNDPVTIHLLAETALTDSKGFEVLSYEELQHLKKDCTLLRNRIEANKRKIALECKLRDAAQSLNRLYTQPKGSTNANGMDGMGHNRHATGSKSSNNEALTKANDEYRASSQRIEELTQELKSMESRLEDTKRRILEHTAGVLQFTHKGLKKNLRKSTLPKNPQDVGSVTQANAFGNGHIDEFDERSLYPVPDYVNDFIQSNPVTPIMPSARQMVPDMKVFDGVAAQLREVSSRMHDMVRRLNHAEDLTPPPDIVNGKTSPDGQDIQGQLGSIFQSLDALVAAQQRSLEEYDNVNTRIHKMLERTNSVSRSPLLAQEESKGDDLASQLAFSTRVLEQLHSRVEGLVEQKDILTRQIQQQRELNTKSDAQRDAQIFDLTEELEESKRNQTMAEQEAGESQNQISLLIEQLDRSKQDVVLMQQQHGMNETKALQSERDARKNVEKELMEDIESKQNLNIQLQADMAKMQHDFEMRSQEHIQQLNEVSTAREQASVEVKRHQTEGDKLLEQMAALQTELTIVKAELDGAYGTRAQRAADVSLNPAVQKEIDALNAKNMQLQKELRETIEDYEQMTKASIEFEKERDQFEGLIDTLRERGEALESQLSEEKLKWLGVKVQAPTETTSTMVLKNEFKKMMRDTRADNVKALKAEQEERRRLEVIIRSMRKENGLATPAKSLAGSYLSAEPTTPSAS